ncbi:PDZ domain-containing protein [candidate division KSB1 bacterium]|nr:PDZ domain-containing protein [candidate division KSB1 bacterium]
MKTNQFSWRAAGIAGFTILVLVLMLMSVSESHAAAKEKKGWLGVQIKELTPSLRDEYSVGDRKGLLITEVVPCSPADKAGLEDEDVILTYDGKQVEKADVFASLVQKTKPRTTVKIGIFREGTEQTINVKIGKAKRTQSAFFQDEFIKKFNIQENGPKLGVKVHPLNKDLAAYFNAAEESGVLVLDVIDDTPAEEAGLKAGDVITQVDDKTIKNPDELIETISDYDEDEEVTIQYIRHGKSGKAKATLKEIETSMQLPGKAGKKIIRKYNTGQGHDVEIFMPDDASPGEFIQPKSRQIIIKKHGTGSDVI